MNELLSMAIAAARAAATSGTRQQGADHGGSSAHHRGFSSPATWSADAEACLQRILLAAQPDYGCLSAAPVDASVHQSKRRLWLISATGGADYPRTGAPGRIISVALVEMGEPLVGVILNAARNELFVAVLAGGAFFDGKRVFCSEVSRPNRASMLVPSTTTAARLAFPGRIATVSSTTYGLALVAAGRAEISAEMAPIHERHVCAGDLLVREAGGELLTRCGRTRTYGQGDPLIRGGLIATNAEMSRYMLSALRERG